MPKPMPNRALPVPPEAVQAAVAALVRAESLRAPPVAQPVIKKRPAEFPAAACR